MTYSWDKEPEERPKVKQRPGPKPKPKGQGMLSNHYTLDAQTMSYLESHKTWGAGSASELIRLAVKKYVMDIVTAPNKKEKQKELEEERAQLREELFINNVQSKQKEK